MKKIFLLLTTILIIQNSSALNIRFKVLNIKNDTLVFGHYIGSYKNMIVLDTMILKKGIGEYSNDTLKDGLFFIYNNKEKNDILLSASDKLKVTYNATAFLKSVEVTGSTIISKFIDYLRFLDDKKNQIKNDSTKASVISKEVKSYQENIIAENRNNILGKFINFFTPLNIPEGTPEEKFSYYKKHFFDNGNIYDKDLYYTPLIDEKLNEYYSVLNGSSAEITRDIDELLTKCKADKDLFRFVLVSTFQHYLKSNQVIAENIWVHIAETWYIPYASWADFAYMTRLKHEIKMRKPNLIGAEAPNFAMTIIEKIGFLAAIDNETIKKDVYQGTETKLNKLLSDNYTLLIFFEADCSHCKEVMPDYYNVFNKYVSKGLKGIVVNNNNTQEGKPEWCDYINKNQMFNWTNSWSPYSNEYKDLYNIVSTPTVYLLHNNKIELKNIDTKTLDSYLQLKLK
jgi:thiol-disulfide isomerase/thioredoxin